MKVEDKILLDEIKTRNRKVFEALFYEYYPHLTRYAEGFLFDKQTCEDIVQNVFIHFLENPANLLGRFQTLEGQTALKNMPK